MRKHISTLMMALALGISLSSSTIVSLAAEGEIQITSTTVSPELNQSPRWYSDQNGVWYLRNESGTGNVVNSWFQDLDGSWYLLADGDGHMYAGLIHDTITNKWYYCQTVHDGYFGRMAFTDGLYTVNGSQVYLTFNQIHDGTFGCITSGLESLQGTGVITTDIAGIPTESESASTSGAVSGGGNTVGNSGTSGSSNSGAGNGTLSEEDRILFDTNKDGVLDEGELIMKDYIEKVRSGEILGGSEGGGGGVWNWQ